MHRYAVREGLHAHPGKALGHLASGHHHHVAPREHSHKGAFETRILVRRHVEVRIPPVRIAAKPRVPGPPPPHVGKRGRALLEHPLLDERPLLVPVPTHGDVHEHGHVDLDVVRGPPEVRALVNLEVHHLLVVERAPHDGPRVVDP